MEGNRILARCEYRQADGNATGTSAESQLTRVFVSLRELKRVQQRWSRRMNPASAQHSNQVANST